MTTRSLSKYRLRAFTDGLIRMSDPEVPMANAAIRERDLEFSDRLLAPKARRTHQHPNVAVTAIAGGKPKEQAKTPNKLIGGLWPLWRLTQGTGCVPRVRQLRLPPRAGARPSGT